MMKMKLMVLSIAVASLLVPVLSWANWNDPTLTADWKKAVLGTAFEVTYYNAPSDARIGIFPKGGSAEAPVVYKTIAKGSGVVNLTLPETAGTHLFSAVMYTVKSGKVEVISEPLQFPADKNTAILEMKTDKEMYAKGAVITVNYRNAPVGNGDAIAIYPQSKGKLAAEPVARQTVTASEGSVTFKISDNGYYSIHYLFEGEKIPGWDAADIIVGTPVTLILPKPKCIPEEDVVVEYKGFSKNNNDWIGVFPFVSNTSTAEPLYSVEIQGYTASEIVIPSGTLAEGSYRLVAFRHNSRNALNSLAVRLTISSGTNSLQYSDDKTITYYNIVSAKDGLCFSTEPLAKEKDKQKMMKLVALNEQSDYVQWKLVKRENGRTDIINRATGEYILTVSTLLGNSNYSKMGIPEETTNNGFTFSYLGKDQYALGSLEDDGVTRYLANMASGDIVTMKKESDSEFAWQMIPVETVVTGIKEARAANESVRVQDHHIVVTGNQDYTLWDAEGKAVGKHQVVMPGIYMVKWADGRNVKVCVR